MTNGMSLPHRFVGWSIKPRIIVADIMRLLEIIGLVEFAKLRLRHFFSLIELGPGNRSYNNI